MHPFLLANLKTSIGSCLKTKPEPPVPQAGQGNTCWQELPIPMLCLHKRTIMTAEAVGRRQFFGSTSTVAEGVQQILDFSQDIIW